MNYSSAFELLSYLYWLLLLALTVGSLVGAALAFKLQKRVYAIVSVGALGAAFLLAAVPAPPGPGSFGVLLGIVALALAVIGGGPAVGLALSLATRNSVTDGAHGGILVANPVAPTPANALTETAPAGGVHEVLRGGLAIGLLERFAAAGSILAGFPEAIAIVVAIKGVGRFTELAAAEARERFIIGTLTSLVWACACAALVRLAIV